MTERCYKIGCGKEVLNIGKLLVEGNA